MSRDFSKGPSTRATPAATTARPHRRPAAARDVMGKASGPEAPVQPPEAAAERGRRPTATAERTPRRQALNRDSVTPFPLIVRAVVRVLCGEYCAVPPYYASVMNEIQAQSVINV